MLKIETKFEMSNSWLKENVSRPPFCQSFEWEEILSREGKDVERLAVFDDEKPVAMALVEYHKLPFGWRYAFCPKGPITARSSQPTVHKIYEVLAGYFKNKKCIFFRFEPMANWELGTENCELRKTVDINPRATMILDLRRTPDELLAGMHQKTRYNINLAQKKDLRVSDIKDADLFMTLMKATGQRDKFRLHQVKHYHEIIFSPLAHQLTVFYGPRPIATAIFAGFGDTFTYVFGASDYDHRSLMAPYLIQWEGIKMGQRYGYRYYDFFGIAPQKGIKSKEQGINDYEYDVKHQYAGVTRFKQGFGGAYHEDPGTFDLIISPWKYRVYNWLRRIRRMI
ncbi:MAG: peptidoglycan bridge formation glycyltransferase FemA/FemB family protein [Patescibacteria group bacterium]|nr:peptidoglycan bridge formation glycyltransferase FemA/FemB family protein [Patescibacteria group bacterium]